MATKLVNGVRVTLSAQEQSNIQADWDANAARPKARQPLTRTQLFSGLFAIGQITEQEAIDGAARNALPAAITAAINGLPVEQQGVARIKAFGAETISYGDSLVLLMASALGMDQTAIDAAWDAGASL